MRGYGLRLMRFAWGSTYRIPSRIIAGRVGILLHTYTNYIVGSAAGLMAPAVA